MPDRGVSIGDPIITAGHVATPQWQSFELRMRHRRADRCVQRAAAAIDAGRLDEASEALAEAQGLNPVASGLDDLLQRLGTLRGPDAPSGTPSSVPPVHAEGDPTTEARAHRHELHAPPSGETEAIPRIEVEPVAPPAARADVAPSIEMETIAAPIAMETVAPPIGIESVASGIDIETQPTEPVERYRNQTLPPARNYAVHPPLEFEALHEIDVEDSYPIDLRAAGPIRIGDPPPIRFETVNPLDLDVEYDPALPIEVLKTPEPPGRNRSTLTAVAVAMLALLLSGAAGWLAWSQWPMNAAREPQARAEIQQSPTVVPQTANPQVAAPAPAPAEPPADAPLQSSELSEPVASPARDEPPEIVTNPEPAPSVGRAAADPEPPDTRPAAGAENTSRPVAPATPAPAATSTTGTRYPAPPIAAPTPEPNPTTPEATSASALPPRPSDVTPRTVVEDAPRPASPAASAGVSTMPGPPAATMAPPAAPPAEAPRPTAPVVDEHAAVRATLGRYESAYSDLNTAAAHAVWPGVDERALARAFDSLSSQRVNLGTCEVGVNGATARAICHGTASWTPKVGGGQQTKSRTWSFDLRQTRGAWQIVRVDAR
jgi:hypothetical protein